MNSAQKVCVVGITVMRKLFQTSNPLGKVIRIKVASAGVNGNIPFRIIGVLEPKGANMFGDDYPKKYIPKRPGEPSRSLADISKIKKDINWQPKIKIEEGVKNLLSKIHYWKDAPVWTPDSIAKVTEDWFRYLS